MVLIAGGALALNDAEGAGFTELRFSAGSHGFVSESLDVALASASGTVAGLGAGSYSEDRLSRSAPSLHASLSAPFGEQTLGLRALAYPRSGASEAWGGGASFQRRGDSEHEYEGSWGLSATWLRQEVRTAPTAPARRDRGFGEGVLEFNSRQSYFEEFNFLLTGAYFHYDSGLEGIRRYRTTFLQSDAATLGTFAPVTEPPRWAFGVQYSRSGEAGTGNSVVLGYSRIGLLKGGRSINSYLLGAQAKLSESLGLQVGFNPVKATRSAWTQYAGATLSWYWR